MKHQAGHHHRASSLKQQNKSHKVGRHDTKSSLAKKLGGKVEKGRSHSGARLATENKKQRLNAAKQQRQKKKEELWLQQRTGGKDGPPKLLALIPLAEHADLDQITNSLLSQATSHHQGIGPQTTMVFQQHRQRCTVYKCERDLQVIVDAAKVADVVVFVLPLHHGAEHAVDHLGEVAISAVRSQGLPSVVAVYQGVDNITGGQRAQADAKKYGHRFFQTEFGDAVKIAEAENSVQLFRAVTTTTSLHVVHWRAMRSYMLADKVDIISRDTSANTVDVRISGYLRGSSMSANQLVHISDLGTFSLKQIEGQNDPSPISSKQKSEAASSMEVTKVDGSTEHLGDTNVVLATADDGERESLTMEADADPLLGEQTWPTEEELADVEMEGEAKGNKKKVKGMSEYQSAWLVWDKETDGDAELEPASDETQMMDSANRGFVDEFEKESDTGSIEEEDEEEDEDDSEGEDITEDQRREELVARRKKKKEDEEEDREFPDEVDVPDEGLAKDRFQRYRGLKSFRTSPWDPKESLPREYARIFQFRNFAASQKAVLEDSAEVEREMNRRLVLSRVTEKQASRSRASSTASMMLGAPSEITTDSYVASGSYVTLHLVGVPSEAIYAKRTDVPFIVGALLKHENKISVVHFNVQKVSTYTEPIKSKDDLVFHYGFRRVNAKPIFSQHNLNSDKNKYERFLQDGRWTVASIYGPVAFQPSFVHIFAEQRQPDGSISSKLVATGTVVGVNPDRIVLKRILLTGTPVRVKRRRATVRYMFNHPEDIRWFKPIELHTKHGLSGHIKESLGTHGDMKCLFNKPIKQHDTVYLPLYKRVYPKFPQAQTRDSTSTAVTIDM